MIIYSSLACCAEVQPYSLFFTMRMVGDEGSFTHLDCPAWNYEFCTVDLFYHKLRQHSLEVNTITLVSQM